MHILMHVFSELNDSLQILFYTLIERKAFTVLKMNIMTEALKFMSEDQFDIRRARLAP